MYPGTSRIGRRPPQAPTPACGAFLCTHMRLYFALPPRDLLDRRLQIDAARLRMQRRYLVLVVPHQLDEPVALHAHAHPDGPGADDEREGQERCVSGATLSPRPGDGTRNRSSGWAQCRLGLAVWPLTVTSCGIGPSRRCCLHAEAAGASGPVLVPAPADHPVLHVELELRQRVAVGGDLAEDLAHQSRELEGDR